MNNTASPLPSAETLFEEALKARDAAKIKKMLSRGFYVNQILKDLPPLSFTLDNRLFELVESLISSGADVCQLDASGKFCPMFYAVKNKAPLKIIRRLILAGAPIDGIVEYNFRSTAIHLAVFGNQKSIIKCLLSLSANVNARDGNGMTPLHVAVRANHPKIVKMLVAKGAELEAASFDKFTPLMLAIHEDNCEMVALLISLGCNVNHEPEESKYSYQKPLNYAVGLGRVEIVRLLLQHQADVKPTASYHDSPLHSLVYSDVLTDKSTIRDLIDLLVEHGEDLNCYNNLGQNPLHSAIVWKKTEVVKSLLKAGASAINGTELNNDTPLHLAAFFGDSKTVKLLLNSGANPAATNKLGVTPYDLALNQKDTATIKAFWSHGHPFDAMRFGNDQEIKSDIRSLIEVQKQFFRSIEFRNYNEMVDALEKGAEPKGCSLLLKYPLHFSVFQKQEKIVRELLERGVSVVVLDENGETALHVACKSGNINICMQLLAHGACYNSRSRSGKTPCQMAEANNHLLVRQMLKCIDLLFGFVLNIEEAVNLMTYIHRTSDRDEDNVTLNDYVRAALNCVNRKGSTILGEALSNGYNEAAQAIMMYRLKHSVKAE